MKRGREGEGYRKRKYLFVYEREREEHCAGGGTIAKRYKYNIHASGGVLVLVHTYIQKLRGIVNNMMTIMTQILRHCNIYIYIYTRTVNTHHIIHPRNRSVV